MEPSRRLSKRLSRDFLLQAIYISLAALVGVFAAATLIEDVLTKQALRGEAEYLWDRLASDPAAGLPETRNMSAYLDDASRSLPAHLEVLTPGFHRISDPHAQLVYVTEREQTRLALVFQSRQVNDLVLAFGLLPLAVVLIAIYVALFLAYRVSTRAVSPIVSLAEQVQKLDPSEPDPSLFVDSGDRDEEIATLYRALRGLAERLTRFAERERTFTRDASHELRSPLTIVRMASKALAEKEALTPSGKRNLSRIRQAARDMEELTEAFLLLARESAHELADEYISVNQVVAAEIEKAQLLVAERPIELLQQFDNSLFVAAPERVVASVVGNLLRNAATYTDEGTVTVELKGNQVRITDTGPGIQPDDLKRLFQPFFRTGQENATEPGDRRRGGFGVGLTIVKRLTDRFLWPLDIQSQPGQGTRVELTFSGARVENHENSPN